MALRRARLLPFKAGRLIRLCLAVSLPLISLVFTFQLTWRAVERVSGELRAPRLWLISDAAPDPDISELFSYRFGARSNLTLTRDSTNLTVLAPRDRPLVVFRNGQPVTPRRDSTGRSFLDQLPLRRGSNLIRASSLRPASEMRGNDNIATQVWVAPPPGSPDPVRLLARWRRTPNTVAVLGLADPGAEIHLEAPGPVRMRTTTGEGTFLAELSIPQSVSKGEIVASSMSGSDRASLSVDGDVFVSPERRISREAFLHVSEHDYTLSIKAVLPVQSRLYSDVAGTLVGPGTFLQEVFGLCFIPEEHHSGGLSFRYVTSRVALSCLENYENDNLVSIPIKIETNGDRAMVSFRVTQSFGRDAISLVYEPQTDLARSFLSLPDDSLTIERTENAPANVFAPGGQADGLINIWNGDRTRAMWKPPGSGYGEDRFATVGTSVDDDTTDAASSDDAPLSVKAAQPNVRQTVRIIDRFFALQANVPSRLRPLISSLVTSIPFFGFFWILSRFPGGRPAHIATLKAVTVTFLLMHITVATLELFGVLLTPSMLEFVRDLYPDKRVTKFVWVLSSATSIYPFLAIGIVLLINPVFKAVRRAEVATEPPRRRSWLRALGWLFFWAAVLLCPAAALYATAEIFDWRGDLLDRLTWVGLLLIAGVCVLWFVLFWLLRGVLRIGIGVGAAVVATCAVLGLPLVPPLFDVANDIARQLIATQLHLYPLLLPERASPYVSAAIVALLGAILLLQTTKLSIRLSQHARTWRWFQEHRRLLLVALMIVSLPVIVGPYETNVVFTMMQVFYLLDRLLPYALVLGAATLLRLLNPNDSFALSLGEVYVGALVFAWYVSGHSSTLLFIPIPFLLAWYLFRHWLVSAAVGIQPASATTVAGFIEDRRTRSRLETLQKGLDKALGQGDLKLSEYQERLKEGQAAATALANGGSDTESRILAAGPEEGPWRNAWSAVRYGFFLSLPLQLITLVRLLGQDSPDFPFLEFSYALVFSAATWILTAAVFGYFYHAIRGRNGFEKALCYSLVVVAPTILLDLLLGRSIADRTQLLDIVQVFAFILVLALVAFDLRTLQKYRYGWRDLFTVYGLACAAYGSTIAVAIASTLSGKELLPKIWDVVKWLAGTGG